MAGNEVASKLLELFDTLSKEFHSLNLSYERLQSNLTQLNNSGQNISDIKSVISDISKDVQTSKDACKRISDATDELLAYKNNIQNIPQDVLDSLNDIKTEISSLKLDDDFIQSTKKIKEVNQLICDLKPVIKFSKLMCKPTGIVAFILIFVLAISGVVFGLIKAAQLWFPPPEKPAIEKIDGMPRTTSQVSLKQKQKVKPPNSP